MSEQLDDCKSQLQQQSLSLQRKEGDISCMAMELEAKTSTVAKLHEQVSRLVAIQWLCVLLQ